MAEARRRFLPPLAPAARNSSPSALRDNSSNCAALQSFLQRGAKFFGFLHAQASPKKISIQVITLIAFSRLIAMGTKQSKRKENHESINSAQKNTNPVTSHCTGADRTRVSAGRTRRRRDRLERDRVDGDRRDCGTT